MNKKKLTALTVLSSLVLSLTALPASAEQYYSDVDEGHWAYNWVDYMHEKGYIHGYPDGTYLPGQKITRAEFVTILNFVLNKTELSEQQFPDVLENDWFYQYIQSAVQAGYLTGYDDGLMRPNGHITREEAAVVISRAYGLHANSDVSAFTDAAEICDWAVPYVGSLAQNGILNGYEDGSFRPHDNMLRAEVATMLAQAAQKAEQGELEQEKIIYPDDLIKTETGYELSGIGVENIDRALKLNLAIAETGDLGEYTVTTKIGDEIIVENGTIEDLTAAFAEKVLTPEDFENLTLSFNGFENAAKDASLKVVVSAADAETGIAVGEQKTYLISFVETSLKWPALKGSNNNYTVEGVEATAIENAKLTITNTSTDALEAYQVSASIGETVIGTFDSIEDLNTALAELVLDTEDLTSLSIKLSSNGQNAFTLKFKVALSDATEGYAIGDTAEYTVNFTKLGGGGFSGGGVTTPSTTPVDDTRDRVVESLHDYRNGLNNSSADRAIANDLKNHGISNDMLKVILTNDGMTTFDPAAVQTAESKKVAAAYNSLKGDLNDTADHYNALFPIYEDVIRYLLENTPELFSVNKQDDLDAISTASKEQYVLLCRTMVAAINEVATIACDIYTDSNIDVNGRWLDFQAKAGSAFANTIGAYKTANAGIFTDEQYTAITDTALEYWVNLYESTNNNGETLKEQMLSTSTVGMTVSKFAKMLKERLPVPTV